MIVGFRCFMYTFLAEMLHVVVIVEALEQGVKDGMDILTLSLGTRQGWASTTTAVVADRIAQSGMIITVAAGNDGDFGSWDSGSPASSKDVISVGSVDKSVFCNLHFRNIFLLFIIKYSHSPPERDSSW
jgi:hypothetical protein